MAYSISVFIPHLPEWFGAIPAFMAVLVLLFAVLAGVLFVKLRSAREKIHQLAKHLGYEPPYGDGTEVLFEEFRKEILLRGKEEQIKKLEEQLAEIKVKAERDNAALVTLRRRTKEVEDQLQKTSERNSQLLTQIREKEEACVAAVELKEKRILSLEAEQIDSVNAIQRRTTEFEEQLQQASIRNSELTAQVDEQAQTHRIIVEQMEESIRSVEAENSAAQLALQKRVGELEDQLQQASTLISQLTAKADEQEQAHRSTVEQMEEHLRSLDAENNASLIVLQQRVQEFEIQLQQAEIQNNEIAVLTAEQAQAHRDIVEQMQQRLQSAEDESNASRQRAQELEVQLQQAEERNNEIAALTAEQAQAHHAIVEQMELRLRDMEAESYAAVTALQQQARQLEEQLEHAALHTSSDESIAQQEAIERIAAIERLQQQVSDLESEKSASASRLNVLQAQVKDLEDQLRQVADRSTAQNGQAAPDTSKHLLRRAEWVTACAVGAVRTLGLVAAEAYAAAAVAADPKNRDAQQLLFELTKLRGATQAPSPSVAEAVTAFDDKAAEFFGADLAGAAHLAQREALDRYHRGLDRSALLVTNFSIALHKQLTPENPLDTRSLQEMRSSLLERLGRDTSRPASS